MKKLYLSLLIITAPLIKAQPSFMITGVDNQTNHDLLITFFAGAKQEEFIKSNTLEKISIPISIIKSQDSYTISPATHIESADGTLAIKLNGSYNLSDNNVTISATTQFSKEQPRTSTTTQKIEPDIDPDAAIIEIFLLIKKDHNNYQAVVEKIKVT